MFSSGKSRQLTAVDVDDRRVVDWESYARQGSASWEQLIADGTEGAEVRVFVAPGDLEETDLGDGVVKLYRPWRMSTPDHEGSLRGFVERESRTALVIGKAYREATGGRLQGARRMTLAIRSAGDSHESGIFVITKVIADGWVESQLGDYEDTCILDSERSISYEEEKEAELKRLARERSREQADDTATLVLPK